MGGSRRCLGMNCGRSSAGGEEACGGGDGGVWRAWLLWEGWVEGE